MLERLRENAVDVAIRRSPFATNYMAAIARTIPPDIMAKARQIVSAHQPEGPSSAESPTLFARALVVEDNFLWMQINIGLAEGAGHDVTTAGSPVKR